MVPVYAIDSFFSFRFYWLATYYDIVRDWYARARRRGGTGTGRGGEEEEGRGRGEVALFF
jgi:hypothetical protein